MQPKISVVTPCRNMANFIGDCIASVAGQKYSNVEHIIIDGGSTDETSEIIKRNVHNLAYWVSEPDSGQAHAINKGIRMATGDLVCWLNADDYFLPHALNRVVAAFEEDQNAPFYFGDGLRVEKDKRIKGGFFPDGIVRFNRAALLLGLDYILQPSAFINRKALQQVGAVNEDLHFGMDWDLWIRLAGRGRPVAIQAKLSASREYDGTKTSEGSFRRIEELRQIASRHCGRQMTPGVLCYLWDELLRYSKSNPDLFSKEFDDQLKRLWGVTASLLQRWDTREDGFPSRDDM
jgi:glycosyltransferase involved in cell wall biosynthesis